MTVYFIRAIGGHGPIKIGESDSVPERLALLSSSSPFPLEVLATLPGGSSEERQLHGVFAPVRLHGEWFEPTASLLALVELARQRKGDEDICAVTMGAIIKSDPRLRVSRPADGPSICARVMEAWRASGVPVEVMALAKRAVLSYDVVARLRWGTAKSPRPETVERLARALGCSARWIETGEGEMRPSPVEATT